MASTRSFLLQSMSYPSYDICVRVITCPLVIILSHFIIFLRDKKARKMGWTQKGGGHNTRRGVDIVLSEEGSKQKEKIKRRFS